MIVSIGSSLPTFKTLTFRKGLNVLLSDKGDASTAKQTRNSAGKTSFVEVLHFLLGSKCDKDSLFRTPALVLHSFRGTFQIGETLLTVERSGSDPSKIFLVGESEGYERLPRKFDKSTERFFVSNVHWCNFLGEAFFKLPLDSKGTAYEESYTPSFRSMITYFARRRESKGFNSPERQAEQQQRFDWQVNLSYLLGLDWQIPFEFQRIRAQEKTLEELRIAMKKGALGDLVGTVAQLRPQVTIADDKASRLRNEISQFQVLDSYKDEAKEAARVKTEMQAIARKRVSLDENLQYLRGAFNAERPPARSDIEQLYEAAGVELPNVALKRLDEVGKFYESVVQNRRQHLQQEINSIEAELVANEKLASQLDDRRSRILNILSGKGALDDFLILQKSLAESEALLANLRQRYNAAEMLEGKSAQLDIDRASLKRRLQEDHQGREAALDRAILIIADTIAELYDDRKGEFVVSATENGPEFRISIEGDRGGGISNMEIFCFDLALLTITTERLGGPGFLVHDSHLFDGVDERQVAGALDLGMKTAEKLGLQYIVTMNSDIFDRLPLPAAIDRLTCVLETRLSDKTETGGLFGFRFE